MKRSILLAAFAAAFALTAQADNILHNVYARQTTLLNGTWQTIADPVDAGYYNYAMGLNAWGYFRNKKPASGLDLVEYDFCDAETLSVPGDWNTQRPELFFYNGSMWYKRNFTYNLQEGRRLYLYFAAANYQTEAWLNGEKLGLHVGGFTPFNFEITDRVKPGENLLVVRVNNTPKPENVPSGNTDWWNYGGLTRDVMLVETPRVSIDNYSLRLAKGRYSLLEASVQLNEPQAGVEVTLSIPELKVRQVLTTDEQGRAAIEIKAKPRLWSPESPKLYAVSLSQNGETLTDEIGFRHIETRGKQILLNGKPQFWRGICVHEEAPYRTGRVHTKADVDTLLTWAQELGCNFLRLAHYPHSEQMVREAERRGFMLWSEIPVYWTIQFQNPDAYANASHQLTENMNRDHNRCAVVVWSVANETPVSGERQKFLAGLARQVKQNDDERFVSMAMELGGVRNDTAHVNDPMNPYVDIISFNCYTGWYGDVLESMAKREWNIPYDKPFFVSEFGAGCKAGFHADEKTKWSEEYQTALYRETLKMYDRQDGFSGCAPWILMDFRSGRRRLHGVQDWFNRKGLISDQGEKKQAFYYLRDYYQTKK